MKRILVLALVVSLLGCGQDEPDVEVDFLRLVGVSEGEPYVRDGVRWRDFTLRVEHLGNGPQIELYTGPERDGIGSFSVYPRFGGASLSRVIRPNDDIFVVPVDGFAEVTIQYQIDPVTTEDSTSLASRISYTFNDEDDDGYYGEINLRVEREDDTVPGDFMPPCPDVCVVTPK